MLVGTSENGFVKEKLPKFLFFLFSLSLVLGITLSLFDVKIGPWRKKKMMKNLQYHFTAYIIDENVLKFSVGVFEVYAEYNFDLTPALLGGVVEEINYHVPRKQLEARGIKNKKFKESTINGLPSFIIYSSGPYRYGKAKERIRSRLGLLY